MQLILSIMTHFGFLFPSAKLGYQDLRLSLPATILCCELLIISMVHLSAFRHSDYLSDGTEYGIKRDSDVTKTAEDEPTSPMIESNVHKQIGLLNEGDKEHIRRTRMLRNRLFGIDALIDCLNPWDQVKQIRQSIYAFRKRA